MSAANREPCVSGTDPWMTAMRRGDFATAWTISDRVLADRRRRAVSCSHWPRHWQFIWSGEPLDDQHVLVRCYHGLGDTIQFARLLEPLRRRARKVTLWAQPALLGVLRDVRGVDELLPLHDGAPKVQYDVDIELMEVAHALRITLDDLSARVPYLHVRGRENPTTMDSSRLNVGIAWRSGDWDPRRSIPTEALAPLASIRGIAFHSLQFPSERLPFRAGEIACRDIERMAQRMCPLDLVITVDTMVAHLAGALGMPTWVLLNESADWRWLEQRRDTPWYPTMHLFRRRGEWVSLVKEVAGALEEVRMETIS